MKKKDQTFQPAELLVQACPYAYNIADIIKSWEKKIQLGKLQNNWIIVVSYIYSGFQYSVFPFFCPKSASVADLFMEKLSLKKSWYFCKEKKYSTSLDINDTVILLCPILVKISG